MADIAQVSRHLEDIRADPTGDLHARLSPALRSFRFMPRLERRASAEAFARWADSSGGHPGVRGAGALLQAMDRFIDEDHQASLRLLTRSRALFAECDDAEGLGLCAMLIGAIYRTFGNFDLALRELFDAYDRLAASGRYPVFVAATANSLANIDLELGHVDEAQQMFAVTYDESTRAGDFYFAIYGLHGLGRIYTSQGRNVEAEEMLQRALALAEFHEHPLHVSNSLTELATLRAGTGAIDEAHALSARALAIREEHRLLGGAITNCLRLGELHGRQGQWDAALRVLRRALAFAEDLGVKPKRALVHEQLALAHEKTGDLEQSLAHYKRFHQLREEVEREDRARALADATAIFEAEQTRRENAVIRQQKAEIERKNAELQDTIDELTRAKIGRKAKALTLGLAIVLFVIQDFILGTALRLLATSNYFALLAVKMVIIFSLLPINRAIERYLLRRVTRQRARETLAAS